MVDTTIATLASQTSFTLSGGSTDDNAYRNCTVVIEDISTAAQKAIGLCSAYTGATKTVTLKYDPDVFTMEATDKVYILAENALKSTLVNRQLNVAADGDIGGNIDGTVASVTGHTPQTADHTTAIAAIPTAVENRTEMEKAGTKLTLINDQTDKMNFTGDDVKATLDGEEVVTDSASRSASKATGFSVPNEYDAVIAAIQSEVNGLDGEAMRGTDITDISGMIIEGTITFKEALMLCKSDGAQTALQHFRNTLDTKNRITAVVDSSGNRTSITLDLT